MPCIPVMRGRCHSCRVNRLRALLLLCACAAITSSCGGDGGTLRPAQVAPAGRLLISGELEATTRRWTESDADALSVHVKGGDLRVTSTNVGKGSIVVPNDLGADVF